MRKKIIAGNWKMNLLQHEARDFAQNLNEGIHSIENHKCSVFLFPGYTLLDCLIKNNSEFNIGAQNFYPEKSGAFTGEVSIDQLKDLKLNTALVGHSERRILFHESNELVRLKVLSALQNDVTPILCIGETIDVRAKGNHFHFVSEQLSSALKGIDSIHLESLILAYEPVWAIGTGVTATAQQAEEIHAHIRSWLSSNFSSELAQHIPILYGGSCNESNANELFSCPNVDGGLIGGASLNVNQFLSIINIMNGLL
jgi:triosephosphate isomerase